MLDCEKTVKCEIPSCKKWCKAGDMYYDDDAYKRLICSQHRHEPELMKIANRVIFNKGSHMEIKGE